MRSGRTCGWIALLAVLAIFCPLGKAAPAQSSESAGEISGIVRFPEDAMFNMAKARLTEKQSGVKRETQTGPNGEFRFEALPPGIYSLELTAWCHKTVRREEIQVTSNTHLSFDLSFSPCGRPEYSPADQRKFWTHAARKTRTEEEKKLIELAEAMPCEKHWLAENEAGGSRAKTCLNKETVDYYFARVDSLRNSPAAQQPHSDLSASANYETSVEFDKVHRQWVVTLMLVYSLGCGNLCGNGSMMSCQVIFDEHQGFIKIIEGTECDCGWIS
jgi:hypothetical protein